MEDNDDSSTVAKETCGPHTNKQNRKKMTQTKLFYAKHAYNIRYSAYDTAGIYPLKLCATHVFGLPIYYVRGVRSINVFKISDYI